MLRLPLLLCLIAAPGLAVALDETPASPFAPVIAEVEKIQSENGLRTASVGFCIIPLDDPSGETAAGYRMDMGLIPGSNLKAVTTATALEVLGGDYRFKTTLQHTGTIGEDGTLTGDVIVLGGGDPTLGTSQIAGTLAKWKNDLAKAGIKKIEGSVVGDASIFGTKLLPESWQWNDIGNYYAAGACGLTFHQNRFYCNFRTRSAGSKAEFIGTDPSLPGIQFINEMRVGPSGSGDKGYIYGNPYGKSFYLRGTVPAGNTYYTIKGSLPDPAFFCARAFTKHLDQNGIPVSGEPSTVRLRTIDGKSIGERVELATQVSDPLSSIIVLTNHKSDNLRAECIHRAIGLGKNNSGAGTTFEAARTTEKYWSAKGIDMTGFKMEDGCGLSRANTVTARQMTRLLHEMAQSENFEAFYNSLPVAGRSGTLKTIGGGSPSEGKIHAKSGTLDRIKNYTGYVTANSGKRFAFTLTINNHTCELWDVKAKIVRVWNKMVAL